MINIFTIEKNDLKRINSYLKMLNEGVPNQIMITGYRAVGKTFFIKKVLNNQPDNILTSYVDLSKISGKEYGKLVKKKF